MQVVRSKNIIMRTKRIDVAKIAGVSEATVSYVLNNTKRVSPEVEKRVKDAAKSLGYVPNRIAQALVGNKTNTIAIMTNDIGNTYQIEVIKGLQAEALKHDYIVYIFDASGDIEKYLQHIISRRIDGIFVVTAPDALSDEKLQELCNADIKVLADFARNTYLPNVSYVMSNIYEGFEKIVKYLSSLGHTRIAYLSAFDEACTYDFRLTAFRLAMKNILSEEYPIVECSKNPYSSTSEVGENLFKKLISRTIDFTAVICTNDLMAIGAMRCAEEMGIKVPEELSFIGIDNISQSEICMPSLTTLSQDGREYGRRVFDVLYSQINDGIVGKYIVPMKLIIRDSTDKPKK